MNQFAFYVESPTYIIYGTLTALDGRDARRQIEEHLTKIPVTATRIEITGVRSKSFHSTLLPRPTGG